MIKIGIYTIAKNEEANVAQWAESCNGADHVTFVDTGSTDGTYHAYMETLTKPQTWRSNYVRAAIEPWRFDTAHNVALSLVPLDIEVCIPLHLDERLMPGWRSEIELNWLSGITTKAFYTYEFSPALTFMQNRIHARKGYVWRHADHEGVYPYGIVEKSMTIPNLKIVQKQDTNKERLQGSLDRLRWAVGETPHSARMAFYYGRQLMYAGRYKEALPYLAGYEGLDGGFPLERAQNAEALAFCLRKLA